MTTVTPRIPVVAPSGMPMTGFTADDWEEWNDANELKIELVGGSLRFMAPPSFGHAQIVSRIMAWLFRHDFAPEVVNAGGGVIVADGIRMPDLMVLRSADHGPAKSRFWGTEIRLAVEVESPSTFHEDRGPKREEYAMAGVAMYWLIAGATEPDAATVTVHTLHRSPFIPTNAYVIAGRYPLAELLATTPDFGVGDDG